MVEEEKEEDRGLSEVGFAGIVVMILVIGTVGYMLINPILQTDDEIKFLEGKINDLNGTGEYKQGWLDCIEYLRDYRYGPRNTTSAGFDPCDTVICNIEPLLVVIGGLGIGVFILLLWSEKKKP